MAGDDVGGSARERDPNTGASSPKPEPTTARTPIPGKETQVGRSLSGDRGGTAKIGQQTLTQKEYGHSGAAKPAPGTFDEAAALLGVTPPAPHHKGNGHAAYPHATQSAADAINSDDGQNATRADLLTIDPPAIHFGRVPFKTGREQIEAAPYEITVHNPTGDPITLDDIRADASADFPIFSADTTDTAIAPGGTLRFRVGFRPHRAGAHSTTIHFVSRGVSLARVTAEATALEDGAAWEDLRLSTHDVRFPDIVLGQESAPRTIHVTNQSGVLVRIEDVAPISGEVDQFRVFQTSADEIPAGASADLTVTFNPTHAGAHRATFHVRTPGAHDKDAAHASIDVRGHGHASRPTEGADALAASIDAGGIVGPMLTYRNMLDALHAAQQFTEAGSADDAEHPEHVRANYDRAEKLVAPVLARLDQLEAQVPELASKMGFSSTNTWQTFGAAHDRVRIWAGQLRGDGRIPADYYVRSFEVGKEVLEALTGEQKDAPTLRALGNAAKWTPLEITGAAVGGGVLGVAGVGTVGLVGDAAAASPSVTAVTNTIAAE